MSYVGWVRNGWMKFGNRVVGSRRGVGCAAWAGAGERARGAEWSREVEVHKSGMGGEVGSGDRSATGGQGKWFGEKGERCKARHGDGKCGVEESSIRRAKEARMRGRSDW